MSKFEQTLSHTYTQLLLLCVLSNQLIARPWWAFIGAVLFCGVLALVIALIKHRTDERSSAPCS